jgi:N-acetylmuramoyl-L-alanine amidase
VHRGRWILRVAVAVGATVAIAGLGGCGATTGGHATPSVSLRPSAAATVTTSAPTSTAAAQSTPAAAAAVPDRSAPGTSHPVIVIDPGHSPSITSTDAATGLIDSDYENEPEMRDVFAVAVLVQTALQADGYQVVMTKNSATDKISLGQRAAVANNAHAALALSIHDQAGANGGIGFTQGNNIVYYQSVGDYRVTPSGTKVTFTDAAIAATSKNCGQIFQAQRATAQGATIRLQGDTGYDLGSRSLPGGNMWMVQLLAKVPWIYNEAGGNSAGQSGLNGTDEQKYANGLVAGVEHCVPITG